MSPTPIPSAAELIDQVVEARLRPLAIQALWDGDSNGWGLYLEAVQRAEAGSHSSLQLVFLRFGGDFRLFSGEVPPWPEARVGAELGEALARHFGVPFYFPSPNEPDDDCPNWWERDRAIRCGDCQKEIIPPSSPHVPKEVCHNCHLKREDRARIREDRPYGDRGVTLVLGEGEAAERVGSGGADRWIIATFALEQLARANESNGPFCIALDGQDLVASEAHLKAHIDGLLERYEPPTEFWIKRTMTYRDRQIDIDVQRDRLGLWWALGELELVEQAASTRTIIRLFFTKGLTQRGAHVLRALVRGSREVQTIIDACGDVLDEAEIRATLDRLEGLGYVTRSGEVVSMTEFGRYAL